MRPIVAVFAFGSLLLCTPAQAEPIRFVATELEAIDLIQNLRDVVLEDFVGEVSFTPESAATLLAGNEARVDVIGATRDQLRSLAAAGALGELDPGLTGLTAKLAPPFATQPGATPYVPWMHATYLMAANRKALAHLPEGAALDSLTYAQLGQWAANLETAAGSARLGFAAGPGGTIDRFVEGYLYPSFTGGMVRGFKSATAVAMWANVQKLWQHVAPASTGYDAMAAPLLAEEVWLAFDHVAHLRDAFLQEPDQFVAFPAPVGAKGRGFMPVTMGLGIAPNVPERAASVRLIDYLMRPATQIVTVQELGFYPTLAMALPENIQPGIRAIGQAMSAQAGASNALPAGLPAGLGAGADRFDQIYRDTFDRIVLDGDDIATVLTSEGQKLEALMIETGARCAPPDAASDGSCPVD